MSTTGSMPTGAGLNGAFEEIRGSAADLSSWRSLLMTQTQPPFQRAETTQSGTGFTGRLSGHVFDRVSAYLIDITASRHVIRRTEEHIRQTPEPLYVVMFQLAGSSVQTQAGSRAVLNPGDYTVATSTVPFTCEFDGDFSVFILRFPQTAIDAPPQSLLPLTGRTFSAGVGFSGHLVPFVDSVARDPEVLRGPMGRRVAQNLMDLFTTSFLTHLEQTSPGDGTPTQSLFQRATAYIASHLGDLDLDPSSIAAAHFISTRYLQAIFQEHGTTVSSWIRERRLAKSRRDLADPIMQEASITEIASKWGFTDPGGYSRAFRQAFGESPKQWRMRARRGASRTGRGPDFADLTLAENRSGT